MTGVPEALDLARQGHEDVREAGLFADLKPWDELPSYEQARLIAMQEAITERQRKQEQAPRLVTVLSPGGRDLIPADSWDRISDGRLLVTRGGTLVAQFENNGWHGVVRAFDAEAEGQVLRDVEDILSGPGSPEDKCQEANRRLCDWRTSGE